MRTVDGPRALVCAGLALLLVAGCASRPGSGPAAAKVAPSQAAAPPGTPAATTPPQASPAQIGEVVWSAMQAGELGAVRARFDATMAAALSQEKLAEVWASVTALFGSLKSWRLDRSAPAGAHTLLVYALSLERGNLEGRLTLDQELAIAGLFLNPAPAAAGAGGSDPVVSTPGIRGEPVEVGAAPWKLAGVITLPGARGKYPGLVLVGGSGPVDRDGTVGPNKPLRDLAEGLSARGIAVLRFEKRTFAHRERLSKDITVEEEVIADAVAALALLRTRPEVDPAAVFVVGHSLGAQLAPVIAERDGKVAGLVLLAPPARRLADAVVDQLRFLGQTPESDLAALAKKASAIYDGSAAADETFMGAPAAYLIDLERRDALGLARRLNRPTLVLRGARDYQVTDSDYRAWREAIREVPGSSAATLPGLNHLFIAGKGKPGPAEYVVAGRVADVAIRRIASFVKRPPRTAKR